MCYGIWHPGQGGVGLVGVVGLLGCGLDPPLDSLSPFSPLIPVYAHSFKPVN